MRLWVRPGVRVGRSLDFSGAVRGAPDTSDIKVLCQPCNPIARQSDSRVTSCQEEKTTLPGAPSCVTELAYVAIGTHVLVGEY